MAYNDGVAEQRQSESFTPVETTGDVAPRVKAGTYAVLVAPGRIYIGGEGTFDTAMFRALDEAELAQIIYVLPNLFTDMAEEYRRQRP